MLESLATKDDVASSNPVRAAAKTMLRYLENYGPLPQITAYRIIRDTYGSEYVVENSRSIRPDVLQAFRSLHKGAVARRNRVWYFSADLRRRRASESSG
jgi:hypothetical protein